MKSFSKNSRNCRNMRILGLMLVAAFSLVLVGCGGNDDKPSGSEERSITGISFDGQIGTAKIERTASNAEVTFQWNTSSGSPASIEIKTLAISEKATASVKVGDKLNFDNAEKTATITVTAENGTPLVWTVIMDPFTPGAGSEENDITEISFGGQIGDATINANNTEVSFYFSLNAGSLASVEVTALAISENATVSVQVGSKLNFDNAQNIATITVTAENGIEAVWTIKMTPVDEPLEGKWAIRGSWQYGGYRGWDVSGVHNLAQKPWRWDDEFGPEVEYDNILEFIIEGVMPDGSTFGTVINDAGDDESYADYLYIAGSASASEDNPHDLNYIYRAIPKGTAQWKRNGSTVTFIFESGEERVCEFGVAEDFGDEGYYTFLETEGGDAVKAPFTDDYVTEEDIQALMNNHAFFFDVQGMGKYYEVQQGDPYWEEYGDDPKFLIDPHFYWIEVEKIN